VDTRNRILGAALEVYGQRGFRGATTRRIAAVAGVNEVTIFRQFGSKQALLTEALREHSHDSPPAAILPGVPSDPTAELSAWTEAHLRWLLSRGQVLRASMGDLEERPEMVDGVVAVQRAALTELSAYLERLRARGLVQSRVDLRAAAVMLMAAIFADPTRSHVEQDEVPLEDRAGSYANVVLTALGTVRRGGEGRHTVRASAPPSVPDATGA
jgi:AcrR family transcriptional regulator